MIMIVIIHRNRNNRPYYYNFNPHLNMNSCDYNRIRNYDSCQLLQTRSGCDTFVHSFFWSPAVPIFTKGLFSMKNNEFMLDSLASFFTVTWHEWHGFSGRGLVVQECFWGRRNVLILDSTRNFAALAATLIVVRHGHTFRPRESTDRSRGQPRPPAWRYHSILDSCSLGSHTWASQGRRLTVEAIIPSTLLARPAAVTDTLHLRGAFWPAGSARLLFTRAPLARLLSPVPAKLIGYWLPEGACISRNCKKKQEIRNWTARKRWRAVGDERSPLEMETMKRVKLSGRRDAFIAQS